MHGTASFIIRNKFTKKVICETFQPSILFKLNYEKYEAVPILQYLCELNAAIKAAN